MERHPLRDKGRHALHEFVGNDGASRLAGSKQEARDSRVSVAAVLVSLAGMGDVRPLVKAVEGLRRLIACFGEVTTRTETLVFTRVAMAVAGTAADILGPFRHGWRGRPETCAIMTRT